MQTVERLDILRKAVDELREQGPVALVPTMGALHEGHLALVREAAVRAASVVVSIFVNPTQFGPNEDLSTYPRQLVADAEALESEGVAILWAPSVDTMYAPGHTTAVSVGALDEGLCGAWRPGHFTGVATVVLKLFNQVRPDVAVFGEKDWQQLAIVRQMARDLDLLYPRAEAIIGLPTVREADDLAMSSRNRYLTSAERQAAAVLPRVMRETVARIAARGDVPMALASLKDTLLDAGFASVDYAELADANSLAPLDQRPPHPARLLVAARIGTTRLIDNMPVAPA